MFKYWTILMITYGEGYFQNDASLLPFASVQECESAVAVMFPMMVETFPRVSMRCVQSVSPSQRPKPRPADLMEPQNDQSE